MLKRKKIRNKGKLSLGNYFQKFNSGDYVAIKRELSLQKPGFPKRMQGRTGKVVSRVGGAYLIEVKDYNQLKKYSIKPIHLKRITVIK